MSYYEGVIYMIIPNSAIFMLWGFIAILTGVVLGIRYLWNLAEKWMWGEK